MNPTHVGTLPTGKRVHFTGPTGWSACSRSLSDITPIEESELAFDEPYCGVCLDNLVDGVGALLLFGLEGCRREERMFAAGWEGKAEIAAGQFILDYLDENPPNAPTRLSTNLGEWGEQLVEHGRCLLKAHHWIDPYDKEGE